MQTGNSIIIHAPRTVIFETIADLEQWPRLLPHYRYVRFIERCADHSVVEMAAMRSGIPISWTSELVVDREKMEIRFLHLKAFTRGMRVIWTFKETPAGVLVEIQHTLRFRVAALAPIAEPIIGRFFVHHVANQTLRVMKEHLEGKIRNSNIEARKQNRMTKIQNSKRDRAPDRLENSCFGLESPASSSISLRVSDFDIRYSNFPL